MTWQTTPFVVLALVLFMGFGWYERRRPPARVVALVATLAALAVVGRMAFAAIPNVMPTTDIVLFAGLALGSVPGFMVGAVTALVSNVFLGHGPWTVWQMVAWGGVGAGGGLLARAVGAREPGRWALAAVCALAGLAFGAFMDVYQWTLAAEQTPGTYLALSASSLGYNLAHVVGNVAFCLLIGPVFVRSLHRYRRRFEVSWPAGVRVPAVPGSAGTALLLAGLAVASGLSVGAAAPSEASAAASPSVRAVGYLLRAQNRDGGFGGDREQASSQLYTGWSALGLAAARRNPSDVKRRRGRSVTGYLRRTGSVRDTGELERTILALRSAGASVGRFRGRNLLSALIARRRRDGSWARNVAHTAFGVLALRAAGRSATAVRRSARWLLAAQNSDGGWGFVARAESDVDDTGAVLQALAAAGMGSGAAVQYLRASQNRDGGFGQMRGRSSNAQSTAWAVQGLVAAGVRPAAVGANPLRYLRGLQRADGHIAYSRTSDQTPVWVTSQALTALRRKPFPLAPVPRRVSRRATASARSGSAGAPDGQAGAGSGPKSGLAAGGKGSSSKAAAGKGARQSGAGAQSARADAGSAGSLISPRGEPDRAAGNAAALVTDPANGVGDSETPSAAVVGAAAAGVLLALWLVRRRLRRSVA